MTIILPNPETKIGGGGCPRWAPGKNVRLHQKNNLNIKGLGAKLRC
jgi:hypothetical protein